MHTDLKTTNRKMARYLSSPPCIICIFKWLRNACLAEQSLDNAFVPGSRCSHKRCAVSLLTKSILPRSEQQREVAGQLSMNIENTFSECVIKLGRFDADRDHKANNKVERRTQPSRGFVLHLKRDKPRDSYSG